MQGQVITTVLALAVAAMLVLPFAVRLGVAIDSAPAPLAAQPPPAAGEPIALALSRPAP